MRVKGDLTFTIIINNQSITLSLSLFKYRSVSSLYTYRLFKAKKMMRSFVSFVNSCCARPRSEKFLFLCCSNVLHLLRWPSFSQQEQEVSGPFNLFNIRGGKEKKLLVHGRARIVSRICKVLCIKVHLSLNYFNQFRKVCTYIIKANLYFRFYTKTKEDSPSFFIMRVLWDDDDDDGIYTNINFLQKK
jgi:hypothetical protein